jgi:ribosome biogenesis protein ENP2
MSLAVTELNNVKVYNLCAGKNKNQFLEEAFRTKKSLRKNLEYKQRIELLQDFDFPTAASRVKASADLQYLAATGVYPPQVRLYDTSEVSMKCQRGLDAQVVQFQFLTDDYRKLVFLCDNRSIELHAQYGRHYSTRIPHFGRDMVYNPFSCEVCIVGASSEVYRLSLDQGRFLASLESHVCEENNVIAWSQPLQWLLVTGGEQGVAEFWDLRSRTPVMQLQTGSALTAAQFDNEGLNLALGLESGIVQLYDLRYPQPCGSVTHLYQLPIIALRYHPTHNSLFSADSKLIKISDKHSANLLTAIEPQDDINDIEIYGDSGLLLTALETSRIGAFYVPAVGLVPRWCSFLESLTEELEEQKKPHVYEDFQFVTHEELKSLDALNLIGSEKLQAYMHGYFMDVSLYYQLKAASQPFTLEEYKKTRVKEKLEAKRAERIVIKRSIPNVNKALAREMQQELQDGEGKRKVAAERVLADQRFTALFNQREFEIDTNAADYKRLHTRTRQIAPEVEDLEDEDSEDAPIVPRKKQKPAQVVEEDMEEQEEGTFQQRLQREERPRREMRSREERGKHRTMVSAKSMLQTSRR